MLLLPLLVLSALLTEAIGQNCSSDVLHVDGTCYYFNINKAKKWVQAKSFCANNYLRFAAPPTMYVNNAIKERLMTFNPQCETSNDHRFWLALGRTSKLQFFHFDNTTEPVPYHDWNPYKEAPEEVLGTNNCVMYSCQNNTHWWETSSCNKNLPAICEMKECPEECIPETTTISSTTASTTVTTELTTEDSKTVIDEDDANDAGGGDNADGKVQTTPSQSGSTAATFGVATSPMTALVSLYILLMKTAI